MLMGDFNVRLARNEHGHTGRYSMHNKTCKGGERVLELLKNTDLEVSSTRFCPTKNSPLGNATYHKEATQKRSKQLAQIDYICVSKRYRSSITSSSNAKVVGLV